MLSTHALATLLLGEKSSHSGIHVRYGCLYSEKNHCFGQELNPLESYCTDWLTALNNK